MSTSGGDPSHLDLLKDLCRLCGERIRKRRGIFSVEKYKGTLAIKFGIYVAHDDPNVHPPSFCHLCYANVRITCRPVKIDNWNVVWNKHTDDGTCLSCKKAEMFRKGGRPKMKKIPGRPRLDPMVAQERQKNQTRIPLPPPTIMTLRSRRKTQTTENIPMSPTSTTATATAPISVAPGVNTPRAGYPKFRKLAPRVAHDNDTPITGTSSAPLHTTVPQNIQGMQDTPFSQSQNYMYAQSLSGMQTPMTFPTLTASQTTSLAQTLLNTSHSTLAQTLNINPQNQANGPSLAPALYLIPGTSGMQGLPSTPLQTLNGIPIIQSLQQPLHNPLVQTAGVFPNMLSFVQPSGILCTLPAVQPFSSQPLIPNPIVEKSEGAILIPNTDTTMLPKTGEASEENLNTILSSLAEETSANVLDDELIEDILPSPNPNSTPSSVDEPSESLPNAEVDQEPQVIRRFVLPSTLERTIQINAFHKHDAEIKCKNCQKMISLVKIDEHEFECVTPFLALHDHNYMFNEEKERRGGRPRKRKDDSEDQMPEAQEDEPMKDMVLIERSVLEELERLAKRK